MPESEESRVLKELAVEYLHDTCGEPSKLGPEAKKAWQEKLEMLHDFINYVDESFQAQDEKHAQWELQEGETTEDTGHTER